MANAMNLVVNLLGNARQLTASMMKAKADVQNLENVVTSSVGSINGKLMSMAAGLSGGLLGGITLGAGVKLAGELEAMKVQMGVLTGSTSVANNLIEDLRKMGQDTPFETADLVKATTTLLAMGRSAGEVRRDLDMLTNIAAGDANKLSSLTLVFGQIASAGRLTGQDLQQLVNQGFNPLTIIAKQTGESMSALKDRMSQGAISFDEVQAAFASATSAGGLFYQMNEKMSDTLVGRFSAMKDQIGTTVTELGEILIDKFNLKELLESSTQWLKDNADDIRKKFGEVADTVNTVIGFFRDYKPAIVSTGSALLTFVGVLKTYRAVTIAAASAKAALIAVTGVGIPVVLAAAASAAAFAGSLHAMTKETDKGIEQTSSLKNELKGLEEAGGKNPMAAFTRDAVSAASDIQKLRDEISLLEGTATESQLALREMLAKGISEEEAYRVIELTEIRDAIKEQQEERKKLFEEAQRAEESHQKTLVSRAESLIESTRTPMEEFQQRLQEMQELLTAGLIDDEIFNRGVAKAREELEKEKGGGKGDRQASASNARLRGSSDAAQAIAAAMNGSNPNKKLETLAQQQLKAIERQTQALTQIRISPLSPQRVRKLEG